MKKWLFMLLFLTSSALATEVDGVKLDDSVQVGDASLQLNGAGVRTKLVFKVYVGALYLSAKKTEAAQVLAEAGAKRVSLHMLRSLTAEKFIHALDEGLEANNSPSELATIETQLKSFRQQMKVIGSVKEGDVIVLDYLPNRATQTSLNGKALGITQGDAFYTAMLKIWLGDHPVDASLKKAMLGQ